MIDLVFGHDLTAKHIALLSFFLLTLILTHITFVTTLNSEEVSTLIQRGENALNSAFENILRADSVGVNVSKLIRQLNEAAYLLERAKIFLEKGMLNEVVNLTSQSIKITGEVNEEAVRLRLLKLTQRESEFRLNFILVIVGVAGFILLLIFLWRWFKDYYHNRVLKSKPEVSEVVET